MDDDEEIDIDLDDPDVEKAATKIQAGFKGHRARKEVKEKQKVKNVEGEDVAHEPEIISKEPEEDQDHKDKDDDHKDQEKKDQEHKEHEHQDLGNKKAIEIQMPMQALADNGDEMELDDNEGEQGPNSIENLLA